MNKVLIVGYGYLGRYLAKAEIQVGKQIEALCRSKFEHPQIVSVTANLDDTDSLTELEVEQKIVYYCAPPPSQGQHDPRIHNFLTAIGKQRPKRVVLISTTGVYGNCNGEWINETRPSNPQADRAHRRWSAEQRLMQWGETNGVKIVVLRVPGIYGTGKLPRKRLLSGQPVLAPEASPYSNRIQIEDLTQACVAAAHHPEPKPLYNVADGHPSTMSDYFFQVADALQLPRPKVITKEEMESQLSLGMRSYLAESKRIDNRLLREHLGVELKYPSLKEGLTACLESPVI
ncbi:MAG: SDR family oxidoreductase [Gammaproteobacteria bacterium]|nr:SDR family oxidoreductase [Gammaproteobacteria bacterium]